MPRLRTLVTISVCGALTANNAIAGGPFSNTNKFGDLFLVMTAAQADAHYWHDVLAGAAISALFTWAIVDNYDPNQNVTLSASSDNVRLGFQTTF